MIYFSFFKVLIMRPFGRSKRGFELQFNWLFVLIAGAVFLGFFFLVIRNQLTASDIDESAAAQSDLSFILRTSQGSRSSEKLIPLPGKFTFSCEDNVSSFSAAGSTFTGQYNYLAIFSPEVLDSKEVMVKTETFKAP